MRYVVNIEDIELVLQEFGGEKQAKDIQTRILDKFCNGDIPENYSHEKSFRQTIQRKMEDYCPQAEGFENNNKPVKFLRVGHGIYRLANINANIKLPEEIEHPENFIEGATKEISVNYYERNQAARNACIDHYVYSCYICDFNFEEIYGEVGRNFIHVHHLKPLHEITKEYQVNPINDLRPVCPNSHAMLHRRKECLDISELKEKLTSA